MPKALYAEIDKQRISEMPQELFQGQIVVVDTAQSAEKAVRHLKKADILGIDTETRPSFKRGVTYNVGLLQIATREMCFLFRLCKMGMPECLKQLLADRYQLKIGLSLTDDLRALHALGEWQDGCYTDLQVYVRQFGIADRSLAKLYANVFGRKISKNQRLTNWEAQHLTQAQQRYAATDAWACIRIYERLEHLKRTNNYILIPQVDMNFLMEATLKDIIENR